MAAIDAGAATQKPVYSDGYKTTVLWLLVLAYTFNFIDRTIIATIGQAIKVDLKVTDTQLGLLGGLYFALLYTVLGIPLARLAERKNRVNIISIAIVIWSAFTALCGTAHNFLMLAVYRFGVGVGEAGLSPPAHSLISDYYEPRKRASALSIYSFGIPLGTMVGAILGGWLTQNFSWRVAFMIVGLPGILVAVAIKLIVKEPPRGHSEPEPAPTSPEAVTVQEQPKPLSVGGEIRELLSVARVLFAKWPVLNMVLGITLASFAGYGAGNFIPPFFIREYGLNYAQVGLLVGLVNGFSAGIGTLAGGFIADRLSKRSARWYALTPALGMLIGTPIYIAAFLQTSWEMTTALLLIPGLFISTYLGPTFGVVQNMVDTRRRATATALLFFFLNLIALGGGPPIAGLIIDHLAAYNFANAGAGFAQAAAGMFGADTGAYQAACPGGLAPAGSPAELAGRCSGALSLATRQGVIIVLGAYLWAGLHYFIASFGVVKALAAARAERGEA